MQGARLQRLVREIGDGEPVWADLLGTRDVGQDDRCGIRAGEVERDGISVVDVTGAVARLGGGHLNITVTIDHPRCVGLHTGETGTEEEHGRQAGRATHGDLSSEGGNVGGVADKNYW